VIRAQYTRTRRTSRRSVLTRQIRLKARSIMLIIATDVSTSVTAPTADKRVALAAKVVR